MAHAKIFPKSICSQYQIDCVCRLAFGVKIEEESKLNFLPTSGFFFVFSRLSGYSSKNHVKKKSDIYCIV